ncbi:MAG: hypothetical protein HQL58_05790 [Magnetococcales bacterium]|nr:hypothetical protein [Magnetococcales bacterium]
MNLTPETAFDPTPYERLPLLSIQAAAWIAGITPEAMKYMMESSGRSCPEVIALFDLVRTGFSLLAQKEAQIGMLRLQLGTTLEREKELTAALQNKLSFEPATLPAAAVTPAPTRSHPTDSYPWPDAPSQLTGRYKTKPKKDKKKK